MKERKKKVSHSINAKCADFEYCDYMLFGLNKRERYDNSNNYDDEDDDDDGDCTMMAGIQGFAINILSVMTYMTITMRNQQHDANNCHQAYFPVL